MRWPTPWLAGCLIAIASAACAGEKLDPYAQSFTTPDLAFADQPQPFATSPQDMLFKPDGSGPFPGLVIMPACSGRSYSLHMFDWARRALDHGYAVLVVDPLTPRGAEQNCSQPRAVAYPRLLKDAFDAANHLRRQPFVDEIGRAHV